MQVQSVQAGQWPHGLTEFTSVQCQCPGPVLKEKFLARRHSPLGNTFMNFKDDDSGSDEPGLSEDPGVDPVMERFTFSHFPLEHLRQKLTLHGNLKSFESNKESFTQVEVPEPRQWQPVYPVQRDKQRNEHQPMELEEPLSTTTVDMAGSLFLEPLSTTTVDTSAGSVFSSSNEEQLQEDEVSWDDVGQYYSKCSMTWEESTSTSDQEKTEQEQEPLLPVTNAVKEKYMTRRFAPLGSTFFDIKDDGLETDDRTSPVYPALERFTFSHFSLEHQRRDCTLNIHSCTSDDIHTPRNQIPCSPYSYPGCFGDHQADPMLSKDFTSELFRCEGVQSSSLLCNYEEYHDNQNFHGAPCVEAIDLAEKSGMRVVDDETNTTLQETTLMVRNIPVKCTQELLLQMWPPDGSYDLLYLPFSFESRRNCGYAFLNFVSHEAASNFKKQWHLQRIRIGTHQAKRALNITFAEVQGRSENMKLFQKYNFKRIKNVRYQPALFDGTERIDFSKYAQSLGSRSSSEA